MGVSSDEKERDAFLIRHVQNALHHYNARHPGGEFDVVKPLMQMMVGFGGQRWLHVNFAELHYRPLLTISKFISLDQLPDPLPVPVAIVEACTIIEEPLDQYKRSRAFCKGHFDILHPKGDRKFVCGNDKDRFYQRLMPLKQLSLGLPFM